jgi:mannose-6-phosphate isomerase
MQPYPLFFQPVLKRTLWGGRRLGDQLGKPIGSGSDYAESWEIVDHGDDQSRVLNGPLKGQTLADLIASDRHGLLGDGVSEGPFPLLLKYLDCNRVLSVQVHPDDSYAASMPQPDLGKTEAWYIVAVEPGSVVYAGLRAGIDRAGLQSAIDHHDIEQALHSLHPRPGDVLFIPAGTVHALGAGLLVAEIQQSSDTTFRLYDWNRVDADGNSRQLHVDQGLEVTDFASGPVAPRRAAATVAGLQRVVECDKFMLQVLRQGSALIGGDGKFHIVTVPRGNAKLQAQTTDIPLLTGDSVLLPAALGPCQLSIDGPAAVLVATV